MFELFPDQPSYEYPQLVNLAYAFVWAFVLASLIAITHRLTFTGDFYPKNFFQALVLGSVVTTMVMMAIGDSLARGLGVFGAMAIIRFRTRIEDPRDVLFLFAALSTGLAIGVFGFTISFTGSLLFCAIAFILHYSPFRSYDFHNHLFFSLQESSQFPMVLEEIKKYCVAHRIVSITVNKENTLRYHLTVAFKKEVTKEAVLDGLKKNELIRQLKITAFEFVNV